MTVGTNPQLPTSGSERERAATDYRTFLRCHEPGRWLERVGEQLSSWLRAKKDGWDVPVAQDGDWTHAHRTLQVRHYSTPAVRAMRAEMSEDTDQGIWRTRILAVEEARGGWISVEVTNNLGRFVAVPTIAKWLIATLQLRDGNSEYSDHARRVGAGAVDTAVDLLLDPSRRSPVFVAASDQAIPFEAWANRLDKWFRETHGVGHALVLDPLATTIFNERMAPGAETRPWTIRTYLRGVDQDDSRTLTRHRFLGTERLAGMKERNLQELLGRVAREQSGRRAAQDEVAAWDRRFARLADRALVDVEKPAVAAGAVARPVLGLDEVRNVLGLDELDRESLLLVKMEADESEQLRLRLREAGHRLEDAKERASSLEDELEYMEDVVDELNDDIRGLQDMERLQGDEIRRLQRRMTDIGKAEEAFDRSVGADPTKVFASYSDLLDGIAELESDGVVFSGDADVTLELERLDTVGSCLSRAWDSCLVLADYVRAKRATDVDNSVDWYLEHTPNGYRTVPKTWHAPTETAVTRANFGNERIFPVPVNVATHGMVQMLAHFKLGRLARHSPRLYYYDDTARSGTIFIGYIGPHLTNTQT